MLHMRSGRAKGYEALGTGNGVGPATSFIPSATGAGASARASHSSAAWSSYNVSASSFYAETTSYSYSSISSSSSSSSSATSTETSSHAVSMPNAYVGAGQLHFSPEMWLAPVVDPYDWSVQGGSSPEGQAFVVKVYAAWRDWVDAGAPDDDADTVDKESGAGVRCGRGRWVRCGRGRWVRGSGCDGGGGEVVNNLRMINEAWCWLLESILLHGIGRFAVVLPCSLFAPSIPIVIYRAREVL
ncbi:uncharacterized protein LAESUDRAFT_804225 [Laetiporus sulphureus 93-53]|uniref:Uncharacterized protein n=1 Tax=Laetiporus sulphureus 93-53 TaxID=1314785 RepID=A0A165B2H4_9APHY|nr:uncharacterized protein LAESUDRAFT_804225 [Laetiporus sulphureus 93-53]KZT00103.1 hypothetical protein LAESUDRAFT_804225 [Laetiporus sulphureus 93-53]